MNVESKVNQNTFIANVKKFQHNYSSQVNTLGALFALCIILSIISPSFLTSNNLISVLNQATMVAILAIGSTFVIISGGIDLSVGAIVAFSTVIMGGLVINHGFNPFLGILVAVVLGVCAGLINGLLITKINMPPFIVTLGTVLIWRGVGLQYANGQTIYGLPSSITWIGQAKIGPIPVAIVITLLLYFLAWFILKKTKLGLNIYAVGGNENAARLSGININRTKIIIYSIAGLLCVIAGLQAAGRTISASPNVADGYELDAIAAVAIGGTSMAGGEGNIWGTLIGAVIMQIIRNGMNLLNIPSFSQRIVLGAVIVAAVAVDCIRRKNKK